MNVKTWIKTLMDVDVATDDLAKLKENPAAYVGSKRDELKLKKLFCLLRLTGEMEGKQYEPLQ